MRSRASRRRLSDNDIRCSASDRRWSPARPAQHVHRRPNNGKGRIPSALAGAHGRNGKRRVETWSAGRAGAHRPSEALHPTRSSEVLPRIALERVQERVPTVPHVAKTRRKFATPDRAVVHCPLFGNLPCGSDCSTTRSDRPFGQAAGSLTTTVATSHTRAVSHEAVTIRWPSGLNRADTTSS